MVTGVGIAVPVTVLGLVFAGVPPFPLPLNKSKPAIEKMMNDVIIKKLAAIILFFSVEFKSLFPIRERLTDSISRNNNNIKTIRIIKDTEYPFEYVVLPVAATSANITTSKLISRRTVVETEDVNSIFLVPPCLLVKITLVIINAIKIRTKATTNIMTAMTNIADAIFLVFYFLISLSFSSLFEF
jgi:hypothetical protein